MGFLERAIRNGIRKGIGDAVGNAVQKAVAPAAAELANKAAGAIDQAAGSTAQSAKQASGLEGALGNLQRSVEGYAAEAAKNIKICPSCGAGATADKKFCPGCGAKLPEKTVADGTVCPSCGKQNTLNTKFCTDCGTKLPAAAQAEQAQTAGDAAVMAEWDEKLPGFPKWSLGGCEFNIEAIDGGYMIFAVRFPGDPDAAYAAMKQYREVLLQNGFRQAGQYPSIEHLYKKENGVCYHADTEHCFGGDPDCATFGFDNYEPTGGFDYMNKSGNSIGGFTIPYGYSWSGVSVQINSPSESKVALAGDSVAVTLSLPPGTNRTFFELPLDAMALEQTEYVNTCDYVMVARGVLGDTSHTITWTEINETSSFYQSDHHLGVSPAGTRETFNEDSGALPTDIRPYTSITLVVDMLSN